MIDGSDGLSSDEARRRLESIGPNAVRTHEARAVDVLLRQIRSPLLGLLVVAASVSFFVGQRSDAIIVGLIVTLSVGLGFVNEYRAARATEALHSQLRHEAVVRRDGSWQQRDVTDLVPGDVVRLSLGSVVPADLSLIEAVGLECDESVLTGESMPVAKHADGDLSSVADQAGDSVTSPSAALMGTVVHAGSGVGLVTATGARAEFGRIAVGLGERQEDTEFQQGLRAFSGLLAKVAAVLTSSIFVINLILQRPVIDALLFSLAIAVGITPQLLPAVVTTSLATGAHRLALRKVLVKRLVCIEDLGDIEVLLTDKTGTLTEGTITYSHALDPAGGPGDRAVVLGLVCNEASVEAGVAVGGNALDVALWNASGLAQFHSEVDGYRRVTSLPFDHDRRMASVLVEGPDGGVIVVKGAAEEVLARCVEVPAGAEGVLAGQFAEGGRVIAVATRTATSDTVLDLSCEQDLTLVGFLTFADLPKISAAPALERLHRLGITVKVVTGDSAVVAEHVCSTLGLPVRDSLTGKQVDALDDADLAVAVKAATVFARVSPEQKARIVRAHRTAGSDIAFMGDGVNDAVALHTADIGISVDTASDVAKDAADILLLEKDLDVLADGVEEGRRIFANTIKYVLMGTSSNFGNMFSAAAASAFLSFLPMLPSQILLNNLLYDAGQLTIPSDRVDPEQLVRPSHWDIAFIRRFMLFFGPISSLFDFMTFAVMLHVFDAGPDLFRSGWFVESLATQSLVIFVIRTRRSPFWKSRPGSLLAGATAAVVITGALLPLSPLAHRLGFAHLPADFFAVLVAMVVAYMVMVEAAKRLFFRLAEPTRRPPRPAHHRRVHRRAARFSSAG